MSTVADVCEQIEISALGHLLAVLVQVTLMDILDLAEDASLEPQKYSRVQVAEWEEELERLDGYAREVCSLLLIHMQRFGENPVSLDMLADCVIARRSLGGFRQTVAGLTRRVPGAVVQIAGGRWGWDHVVGLSFEVREAEMRVAELKSAVEGVLPGVSTVRLNHDERYFRGVLEGLKGMTALNDEEVGDRMRKSVEALCKEGLRLVKKGRHHTLKSYFDLIYSKDEEALVRTVMWVQGKEREAMALVERRRALSRETV